MLKDYCIGFNVQNIRTVLCGPIKEFSRVILIISHYVTAPLISSIKAVIASQCVANHFSDHSEGQFGKSWQCAGFGRTVSFISRYLPCVRHLY